MREDFSKEYNSLEAVVRLISVDRFAFLVFLRPLHGANSRASLEMQVFLMAVCESRTWALPAEKRQHK